MRPSRPGTRSQTKPTYEHEYEVDELCMNSLRKRAIARQCNCLCAQTRYEAAVQMFSYEKSGGGRGGAGSWTCRREGACVGKPTVV